MVIVFFVLALAFLAFGLFDIYRRTRWLMYSLSAVFLVLAILKLLFDLIFLTLVLIGAGLFIVITIIVVIRTSIRNNKSNNY